MYLEYCNYDRSDISIFQDEVNAIYDLIEYGVDGLSLDLLFLRKMSTFLPSHKITIASCVDYPYGSADYKVREHQSLSLLKSGANTIDLMTRRLDSDMIDYDALKKEVLAILRMCKDYSANLRLILNSKHCEISEVVEICQYLSFIGIDTVIPGHNCEDFVDKLILCHIIEESTGMRCINNGYITTQDHMNQFKDSDVYGLRMYNSNRKRCINSMEQEL